ncbi:MAG: hypothetical protein ACRCU1_01860 [Alsobacter sp.]
MTVAVYDVPPEASPTLDLRGTPTATRKPMTTQEELDELSDSHVLSLPRATLDRMLLGRAKRAEAAALEAADTAVELRGHLASLASNQDRLAKQQAAAAAQLADHAGKIEFLVRRVAIGGGVGGVALVALKVVEMLTQ